MSSITVSGSVSDVQTRTVGDGRTMATFSVREAGRKDRDGNRPAHFWDCVAFGDLAENLAALLQKGDRVIVSGRTDPQEWESDGGTRRKAGIVVDDAGWEFRFGAPERLGIGGGGGGAVASPPKPDDDVPF